MADVTLTAALRSNLLSLQGTQKLLDSTQLRLATGKKVNSALDNANSFFASRALTFRASDLSNLLDGMGQAIQVLKAADQGITSLTGLVEQAQSIAQGARDAVSNSGLARSGDFTAAAAANLTVAGGITAGTVTLASSAAGVSNATITITAGMTLTQLAAAVNATTGFTAQLVDTGTTTSTFTGGKRIEIRATGGNLTITNGTSANFMTVFQAGVGGGTVGARGDTGGVTASAAAITSSANSTEEVASVAQYNAVRTQINQLIADTGYRGTNLLNGDSLVTKFNESGSSSQSVTGVTFNASGLGISAANFLNAANMDSAINEVKAALNSLRAQAKAFGNNLTVIQTRQDFTSNLINTLKEGSDKLTLADKNEEGANLLSLQTSQELGITALSLASQASQSVLRLFS